MRTPRWRAVVIFLIIGASALALLYVGTFIVVGDPGSCDSGVLDSIQAENARGDTARAEIEICNFFATVVNTSISLQLHDAARIWPRKTLIAFEWADNSGEPVLRLIDDNTLSVDLGEVYWVSSRLDKIGSVRIIYTYSEVDRPR